MRLTTRNTSQNSRQSPIGGGRCSWRASRNKCRGGIVGGVSYGVPRRQRSRNEDSDSPAHLDSRATSGGLGESERGAESSFGAARRLEGRHDHHDRGAGPRGRRGEEDQGGGRGEGA